MTKQYTMSDVSMRSDWRCYQSSSGSYISTTPSTDEETQNLVIDGLPDGAIIHSATLTYTINSPSTSTGAAISQIAGQTVGWRPGTYSISLSITGNGTYPILFRFKAYGSSHEHTQSHYATLVYRNITVTVDYEDPYYASDWSVNAPSVEAGNPVPITISPAGSGYSHHLLMTFGSYSTEAWLEANVNVASLATAIAWCNAIPNSLSGTATITLTTYFGGNAIGSSSKTVGITVPASVVPTLGANVTRVLTVGGVTYPDVTGGYVQQKSAVKADITSASGAYGSSITAYSINVGGQSAAAYNTTGTSLTSPLLPMSGTVNITFRVTDSRGRSAQVIRTITVDAYSAPKASLFQVLRADENGSEDANGTRGRYSFTRVYTSLGGKNSCTAAITAAGTTVSGVEDSGWIVPGAIKTLDVLLSYDVVLTLTDAYESVTVTARIPSINFAMHFSADGTATWIGEACQKSNAFGVAPSRDVYFYGKELRSMVPVRNLLDNSDFTNPVNQRGASSYSEVGYTIDRWRTWTAPATVSVQSGYVSFTKPLYQYVPTAKTDQTYTLAVCNTNNQVFLYSGKPQDLTGTAHLGLYYDTNIGTPYVLIGAGVGNLKWAALYEGEYTADTLPPYVSKGYAAELLECQRYFYLVPNGEGGIAYTGYFSSSTNFRMTIPTPVPMRVNPTVSADDVTKINIYGADHNSSATAISVNQRHGNGVYVDVTMSGATAWRVGSARLNTLVYLSADL